eukprot:Polyplicarium_translucidae@DN3210_c0_g1_i11.p3
MFMIVWFVRSACPLVAGRLGSDVLCSTLCASRARLNHHSYSAPRSEMHGVLAGRSLHFGPLRQVVNGHKRVSVSGRGFRQGANRINPHELQVMVHLHARQVGGSPKLLP